MSTLYDMVREWVVANGPCTVSRVCAEFSRHVSAAKAAARGRCIVRTNIKHGNVAASSWPVAKIIARGKRTFIGTILSQLYRKGSLGRPSKGVYAAPAPKLYQPSRQRTA